jgi:cytochrome c2
LAGANGKVGPDLTDVAERTEIAGKLANDPDAMVRWLMHPQAIAPQGGMPDQGVREQEARDMAAYLYAQ